MADLAVNMTDFAVNIANLAANMADLVVIMADLAVNMANLAVNMADLSGVSVVFLRFFRIVLASCWLPGPGRPQDPSKKASGPILNDFWPICLTICGRFLKDVWSMFGQFLVEFWYGRLWLDCLVDFCYHSESIILRSLR